MCWLYNKLGAMKLYATILLAVFSISCYADEIYGIGISKDIQEADLMAIENLSKSIKSEVSCKERLEVEVNHGKKSEKYDKHVEASTKLIIRYSQQEVQFKNGKYVVKRSLDVDEYIVSKLTSFNGYIDDAASAMALDCPNRLNIALGNYYKAYSIINDDVFIACYDDAYDLMNSVIEKAKDIYSHFCFLIKYDCGDEHYSVEGKLLHVYLSGIDEQERNGVQLYDFEYFDGESWIIPHIFFSEPCMHRYERMIKRSCLIKDCGKEIKYRPIYEIFSEGHIIRINVPENWYFEDRVLKNKSVYL